MSPRTSSPPVRLAVLVASLGLAACTDAKQGPAPIDPAAHPGEPAPVEQPSSSEVRRYKVARHGTVLGTIEVRPGEPGELTLTSDTEDAKRLAAMWDEVKASRSFSIRMHEPTPDSGRGAYGARMYRVGDADYAEAVHWKLLDEYYDVAVLPGEP